MLLNRTVEWARGLGRHQRLLRRRARAGGERPPLVLIPPILGTRLRDARRRPLWGYTRCLLRGKPTDGLVPVRLDGVLGQLRLVPGIYAHDVYGGLLRFLVSVGGYRWGEDLAVLSYDWRLGVVAGAAALARLVAELQRNHERVDLLCPSSGGLVARYYLAYGGRDVLADPTAAPAGEGTPAVRRVVYLGTPQRGTLEALDVLQNGFRFVPVVGRHFGPLDVAHCQITYDLLPHPDDAVLADARGEDLRCDLYDPAIWQQYGWRTPPGVDTAHHLERAKLLHRALDRAPAHRDLFVIGAVHRPTRRRLLRERGAVQVSCSCAGAADRAELPWFGPGDGSVPEHSLLGVPGLAPGRVCHLTPRTHRDLSSEPEAHRLLLEALLAPEGQGPSA